MIWISSPRCCWASLPLALLACSSDTEPPVEPAYPVCTLPKENPRFVALVEAGFAVQGEIFGVLSDGRAVFFSDFHPMTEMTAAADERGESCLKTLSLNGIGVGLSFEDHVTIFGNGYLDLPTDPYIGKPPDGVTFVQVNSGGSSVFAIDANGAVHAMYSSTGTFVPVDLPEQARRIISRDSNCVETVGGNVWCRWPVPTGGSPFGLGNVKLSYFTKLELGRPAHSFVVNNSASCFLDAEGVTYCAGHNGPGNFGLDPSVDEYRSTFEPVPGVPSFLRLYSGVSTLCGSTQEGDVWCWGANSPWLIDPKIGFLNPPQIVGTFPGLQDFVMGNGRSCALLEDGAAACTYLYEHPLDCPETDPYGWTIVDPAGCR